MKTKEGAADMNNKKTENNREAKQLTDEEVETVTGGMKVATDGQQSWWRSILDLFFKNKS